MRGSRPGWRGALTVAILVVVSAVAGWSLRTVFAPAVSVGGDAPWTTVEVALGEVGSSIELNSVASWPSTPLGVNRAVGTVTEVLVGPGEEVRSGALLYSVDLRPVVIALGKVPSFRDLSRGARGQDVRQLQEFLVSSGFLTGPADGDFGVDTERGVRAWQRAAGMADDGVIRAGDLLFVPSLPVRLVLDPEVLRPGAQLVGGEAALSMVAAEPVFTVPASPDQASMIPLGTRVELRFAESRWEAVVTDQEASAEGDATVQLRLGPVEGAGSICGGECGGLPVGERAVFPSTVELQPTVEGLVVPSSALRSGAGGEVTVVDAAGLSRDVTVVASARGMSVIEGLQAGDRVRVPADASEGSA